MSIPSVRTAIRKALEHSANGKPAVTRDEARAIIEAATTGTRGADRVSAGEAKLLAQLAGESGFDVSAPSVLDEGAREEREAFYARSNLPLGANAKRMRDSIAGLLEGAALPAPLEKAPSTRYLNSLEIDPGRRAFIDSKDGTFHLEVKDGEGVRWYGPLSLEAEADGRQAELDALRGQIAEATEDLWFISESDHPFDFFLAEGAGTAKPTMEQFLKTLGQEPGTPVELRDFAEFFADLSTPEDWWGDTEHEDAAKYSQLRAALETNLTDLQVIRVGEIEIGVYVVGRNAHGDLVGVSTVSVET
ncbi:MAG: nuclease A inhibitor family protein [Myxococcales bacterium]|jgi:hypothetical protein